MVKKNIYIKFFIIEFLFLKTNIYFCELIQEEEQRKKKLLIENKEKKKNRFDGIYS